MFLFFGAFVCVQDPLVPKDWTGEALPASDEEKGALGFSVRFVISRYWFGVLCTCG